jgi:quinol monooxygenase YgiN
VRLPTLVGAIRGYRTLFTPIKITVLLNAHLGRLDELRALLDGLVEPSRAEPGNLRFDIWQDQANPNRFVLDELYTDNTAVAAHRATQHVQAYLSKINELADRNSMTLNPVVVG